MKMLTLVIALLAAPIAGVRAADFLPVLEGNRIGGTLTQIDWPVSLHDDLKSGIENRLLIRVSLFANAEPVRQIEAAILVKYDLWDEVFRLRSLVGADLQAQIEFRQAQEVIEYLAKIHLARLFLLDSIPPGASLTLRAEVLMNPVGREKIERLRKWVAANSAPNGIGVPQSATLTSRPNDLFNRIFEQYVAGDDIAAPWKTILVSTPFDIRTLQRKIPEP